MNRKKGGLRPLLRLMGKMSFADEYWAYALITAFVAMHKGLKPIKKGVPLVLFGPKGCGKTRISTAIKEAIGVGDIYGGVFCVDGMACGELDATFQGDGTVAVFRDVCGNACRLVEWLKTRPWNVTKDVIIETSDLRTLSRLMKLGLCVCVVFDGLPTDAKKGGAK